jgi:hypothetical protein
MTTLPAMVDGKTRRPMGMRADVADTDPRTDAHPDGRGTMGRVAFFEFREDAVSAAAEWCAGWDAHPQYFGRYDLWAISARRRSWSSGRHIWVEACRDPEAVVTGHAHVPDRFSYDRLEADRAARA